MPGMQVNTHDKNNLRVVVVVVWEPAPTEVVVEEETAAAKFTGVEIKKGSGDMESPDPTNITEEIERTPLEGTRTTKTMEDEMVPTGVVEEMAEMLSGLVHGKDPTKTSIMQHVMDKVTYQL